MFVLKLVLLPNFTRRKRRGLNPIELLEDFFNLLGTETIILCILSTSFIAERK